jgi:hypothetical protein
MKKLSILLFVLVGFAVSSNAQSSVTASTTATLVVPISIAKSVDLNFGTVGASATAGTVILAAADGSRTITGGAKAFSTGAGAAASFTVTGEGTSTFSITLPAAPITLTRTTAGGTTGVTAGSFLHTAGTTPTLAGGTKTFTVGATLTLPVGVLAGTYSNANELLVTVNYN